jgi:hypothetical protein
MSAATLAKVGFCFRLERLFPFDAGRRSDGEIPEDVFGLYFVECTGVLRLSNKCRNENRRGDCRKTSNQPPNRTAKNERTS